MSDQAARTRIDRWKQALLDPADPLMDLGDDGLALAIDPVRIAFALAAGSALSFEAGQEAGFDSGRLRVVAAPDVLSQQLVALRRAADGHGRAQQLLWLALGLVSWCGGDGFMRTSPLALWPVELVSDADGSVRLRACRDARPRLNDMLLEGLRREHDITLDMGGSFDLGALLDAATAALWDHEGWSVERTVRLVTLSFERFDLWRDLEARGDGLFANLAASWLAQERTPPALYTPDGQELFAPLDADAAQLAAVLAAGAGNSFVLDGAAGTGKTHTLANLAVHCASGGKTVLVVSEHVASLEAMLQRLGSVGMAELCLPLHAGRKRVLATLARVFERTFKPAAPPSLGDARIGALRGALDDCATALHRVRPLGMSIHEVLGRLVELRTTPRAALADRDAAGLDRSTFLRRKAAVNALADAAAAVEPVALHPWHLSALDGWSNDATERVTRALGELGSTVETLLSAIDDVDALVPGIVAKTPEQLRALGALADLAAASPRPGSDVLTSMRGVRHDDIGERVALIRARGGGALEVPRDPSAFLAIATRQAALAAEVADFFTEAIEDLDAGELWSKLKRWTASTAALRYVALRTVRAAVRASAQPGQIDSDERMIRALEAVIAERACREALLAAAEPARRWFGELGGDPLDLDLVGIEEAVVWGAELRRAFDQLTIASGESGRQAAWRSLVAQVSASPDTHEKAGVELAPFARLASAILRWEPALAELAAATGIPLASLGAGTSHVTTLRDQVSALRASLDSFASWVRFHLARRDAQSAGVGPSIAAIERGDLDSDDLADAWERATLLAWLELELAETPALADWNGAQHHADVASFADLDRGALALTRARVIARIADRLPRVKDGSDPEVAALRAELDAATPRALRDVLADLPTLTPRITPIVLATPHALAEHMPAAEVDVVVFDDASSVNVCRALGALARGKSVVIAGDSRQLADEDGDGLLALAHAAKLPVLSMTANYRSRHEDVFAFANQRFYGERVEVLPATHTSSDHGIRWRRAGLDGLVTDLRARLADPAQPSRSFAVITITDAQRELVQDLLGTTNNGDRLIVATPEQMQGEERDVVMLVLGEPGDAVPRASDTALATALTRARDQLVVYSTFEPEQIDFDEAANARLVAELLAFARAGGGAGRPPVDVWPATPITAAIARALTDRGWTVRHCVGCGPYKLDLAVVDPNDPERYVLAIENDGVAYATATGTRSRDRLRAQLLAQLGWRVHRVWSLDWWLDAEREIQRAHGAIVAAVAASRQRRTTLQPTARPMRARASIAPRVTARMTTPPPAAVPVPAPDDPTQPTGSNVLAAGSGPNGAVGALGELPEGSGPVTPVRLPRGAIGIGPYMAAAVPAGRRAPDDMFAPRYAAELGKCIEQVLAAEAPMHVDVLARRVGAYFGIGRVTPPVLAQIKSALVGRGKLGDEPGIVWRADQDPAAVPGVRVTGQGTGRRDIAEVPLSEVAAAARVVVERASGVPTADLIRDCARLLGFTRITEQVTARVGLGVRLATARELIALDGGKAHLLLE